MPARERGHGQLKTVLVSSEIPSDYTSRHAICKVGEANIFEGFLHIQLLRTSKRGPDPAQLLRVAKKRT